jgi:hypothetical protein
MLTMTAVLILADWDVEFGASGQVRSVNAVTALSQLRIREDLMDLLQYLLICISFFHHSNSLFIDLLNPY